MNKAIFLDRDGTIIEEKGYLSNIEDINFLEGTIEGLQKLQEDFLLIIITNQSGVARGYFTEDTVKKINNEISRKLKDNNINITETYYCPHHINGIIKKYAIDCNCRKPKTGLIKLAISKYNIDLSLSYVIGDKDSDLLLAKEAGCKSILIKNNNYKNVEKPTYLADNILTAAKYILNRKK